MTPRFVTQKRENSQGVPPENWEGCAAHFLKPLPYFRPNTVIFSTLGYFKPDQNFDTQCQT